MKLLVYEGQPQPGAGEATAGRGGGSSRGQVRNLKLQVDCKIATYLHALLHRQQPTRLSGP